MPDQLEYVAAAESLLAAEGLAFSDERFGQVVRAYRMPGYPLLVAACGANVTVVRLVQALLDTTSVLAIVLLAHRFLPARHALLAGWFTALNPFLIFFSALLLTETLFIALLAWGTALCGGVMRRSVGWWIGALLLAVAVLVRPAGIGLPMVIAGFAVAVHNRHPFNPGTRWPVPPVATVALLVALVLTPWALRNWSVVGTPIPTTTNSGVTLYDGLNPDATGASDQTVLTMMPQLRRMDEVQRHRYLAGRAWMFVQEHPWRAATLAVVKAGRTWSPIPLSDQFGGQPAYVVIAAAWAIPLFLLALAGLVFGRVPVSVKIFLLLPAVYVTLVHAVTVGSLRYRLPAEPFLGILAAAAVHGLILTRTERRQTNAAADVLSNDTPVPDAA
ncbi:MAG: glycosyltransferase family 39 protein [Planctomycetota bacterium]